MSGSRRNRGPKIAVNVGMETPRTPPAGSIPTAEDAVQRRIDGIMDWLQANSPECFEEQLHTVEGSPERAYWHYGYMVALRDLTALLAPKGGRN